MGNLIRAEFYRLRRRPHSVLGMALILLLGVSLLTVSCALPPQVGSAATLLQSINTLSVSGMFFAVWCAAAASSGVNKLDILKHEAVFGIPRWQIYLSRLATACLLGVGLVALLSLWAVLLTLFFLPGPGLLPALAQYLTLTLTALPLWMASAGLFLCCRFVTRSDAVSVVLVLLYYFVGYPFCAAAYAAGPGLSPLFRFLYVTHPMTPFWNGSLLLAAGPSPELGISLDPTLFVSFPPAPLPCWLVGLGWLAVTTLLALAVLDRRELR